MTERPRKLDVFISHASEDKDAFVRPLVVALQTLGVSVWYDEFSLEVGDSISRSIDRGLAESAYGIAVISPAFIGKSWPEYESRGGSRAEKSERTRLFFRFGTVSLVSRLFDSAQPSLNNWLSTPAGWGRKKLPSKF